MKDKIEYSDNITIGIVLSMFLYAIYTYVADKFIPLYKMDNMTIFFIYFIPLIVFYVEIPILLRSDR